MSVYERKLTWAALERVTIGGRVDQIALTIERRGADRDCWRVNRARCRVGLPP